MAFDLGSIVATLSAEVGPFEEAFRTAESRLAGFAGLATGFGSTLTETVSVPLAAIGGIALAAANTIDEAMSDIARRTGASGQELASLGEQFNAAYAKSNQGAVDLATGESILASRTHDTGEVLGGLLQKLDALADMTGGNVAPLATQAADVFRRWGTATGEQGSQLDLMSRAAQLSGTSVSDLMDSVSAGAPFLKAMNLDFTTSVSMLGSLGAAGVNTTQFVTGLRFALTQMAKEGITDANDAFRTLIERIRDANTPLEAIDIAIKAFGPRVGVQLADAIRSGSFSIDDFKARLLTSVKPIEDLTESTKTLGERWTETWHQFQLAVAPVGQAISSVISTSLIPSIQSVIEKLAGFGQAFNNLSPETKTRIVEIGAALIALGPSIILAEGAFKLLIAPISGVIAAFATFLPSLATLQTAFMFAVTTVAPFVVGLTAVAAAIVGVGTITQLLSDNWRVWWAQIEQIALMSLGGVIQKIGEYSLALAKLAQAGGLSTLAAGFTGVAQIASTAVGGILAKVDQLGPEASKSTTSMSTAFSEFVANAKTAVGDASTWLGGKLSEGATLASTAVTNAVGGIQSALVTIAPAAEAAGSAIGSAISTGASSAMSAVDAAAAKLDAFIAKSHAEALGTPAGSTATTLAEATAAGNVQLGGGALPSLIGEGGVTPEGTITVGPTEIVGPPKPIDIPVTASGSPSMPLTDYFRSYAPGVVKDFVAGVPGLDVRTTFSGLGASEKSNLSGAISLAAQGTAADPAQLASTIAALKDYVATWRGVNQALVRGGLQDPFGLMSGERIQDTSAGQLAGAGRLLEVLQMTLMQIQGLRSAVDRQQATGQATAIASQRTAAASERTASVFGGGFGGVSAAAAQSAARTATGNRGFILGR